MLRWIFALLLLLQSTVVFAVDEKPDISLKGLLNAVPTAQAATPNVALSVQDRRNQLKLIEIKGLKHLPEALVRGEILLQTDDVLSETKVNRSTRNLLAMGLFAEVTTEQQPYHGGKKLIFKIKENPVVGKIVFDGVTVTGNQVVKEGVVSKEGDVLNLNLVRKDIAGVEDVYHRAGYILAKVYSVTTPEKDNDPIVFHVSEGIIDEIVITGNTRTRDYVILREMDLQVGQPLQEKVFKKDLRKIYNLNYFSKLEPDFLSGNKPYQYKLRLDIAEKSTGSVNFGGGYGQRTGLFLYSDLSLDNLFGTGQMVMLRGQWGRSDSYQFKYHNPWMWDHRRSFTFRSWYTQGLAGFSTFSNAGFRQETRGGLDMTFGIPYSYELRTTHTFKYENVSVPSSNATPKYGIRSYAFGISYDTRDVMFNPSDGYYHSLSIEKAFKTESLALDFTKYDLSLSKFTPTFEKQTIATRLMVGVMNGSLPDTELYYVGGPNTVRGYADFPDSFGRGRYLAVTNLEYRFLFSDMFQALLFVDAGWSNSLGDLTNGRIGKGAGVRVGTPLGPLRLDFGFDDEGIMRTHFNIGNVF